MPNTGPHEVHPEVADGLAPTWCSDVCTQHVHQWHLVLGPCISGPVFCLLLGISSDYAQPITGQVTEVNCPVIGQAQPELTPSKRQKTSPGFPDVLQELQATDHWHISHCVIDWPESVSIQVMADPLTSSKPLMLAYSLLSPWKQTYCLQNCSKSVQASMCNVDLFMETINEGQNWNNCQFFPYLCRFSSTNIDFFDYVKLSFKGEKQSLWKITCRFNIWMGFVGQILSK